MPLWLLNVRPQRHQDTKGHNLIAPASVDVAQLFSRKQQMLARAWVKRKRVLYVKRHALRFAKRAPASLLYIVQHPRTFVPFATEKHERTLALWVGRYTTPFTQTLRVLVPLWLTIFKPQRHEGTRINSGNVVQPHPLSPSHINFTFISCSSGQVSVNLYIVHYMRL